MATPTLQPVLVSVPSSAPSRFRKAEVIMVSLICLVVPLFAGIYMSPKAGWFVIALLMIAYLLFLGRWISGRPLGILVNERNLMSLSRFQLVAWTVLLLSAFLLIALKRLHVLWSNPAASPLNVSMDWRLWALMGISATSLVGSPLILSTKTSESPAPKAVEKAAETLNEPSAEIQKNSQGTLYSNSHISDASLTAIAIVTYSYAVYSGMANIYSPERFLMPVPSDALVALLGISHAAFLTSKATSHS